jgi:hypothetical protein
MQTLKINEKDYAVKFDYSVILDFCERKGIELYQYSELMAGINFAKITNEAVRTLSLLIWCSIKSAFDDDGEDLTLTTKDIVNAMFSQEGFIESAISAIQHDMPVKKKVIAKEMSG